MKKSLKFLALLLAASLLFTSCGDIMGMLGGGGLPGGGSLPDPETPEVELDVNEEYSLRFESNLNLKIKDVTVSDNGKLSYQWYSGTTDDFNKAIAVSGATNKSYSFKAGTTDAVIYYWCEVTNSKNGKTAKTHSDSIKLEVTNTIIIDGNITTSTQWTEECTYWIKDDIHVTNNAKLIISQGTVVKFAEHAFLGTSGGGKIVATGADFGGGVTKYVIFTSERDNSVGRSVYNGTQEPEAGWWEGITTESNGSEFKFCKIMYAGSEYCGALHVCAATTVENCEFSHNASPDTYVGAINIEEEGVTGTSISDTVFYDNDWPLSCPANFAVDTWPTSNVFHFGEGEDIVKNAHQAIFLKDSDIPAGTSVSFLVEEVPYLADDIDVYGNLDISSDVVVRFLDDCCLDVFEGGHLQLQADTILTSYQDDAHGGDINGDGVDTARDGDWQGVWVEGEGWNNSINTGVNVLFEDPNHVR